MSMHGGHPIDELERRLRSRNLQPSEAVAYYRSATTADRAALSPAALLSIVESAQRLGDYKLVVATVGELLRIHPSSHVVPRALWEAATAQRAAGRTDLEHRTLRALASGHASDPLGVKANLLLRTREAALTSLEQGVAGEGDAAIFDGRTKIVPEPRAPSDLVPDFGATARAPTLRTADVGTGGVQTGTPRYGAAPRVGPPIRREGTSLVVRDGSSLPEFDILTGAEGSYRAYWERVVWFPTWAWIVVLPALAVPILEVRALGVVVALAVLLSAKRSGRVRFFGEPRLRVHRAVGWLAISGTLLLAGVAPQLTADRGTAAAIACVALVVAVWLWSAAGRPFRVDRIEGGYLYLRVRPAFWAATQRLEASAQTIRMGSVD